jgi:hypothetical protein
MANFTEYEFTIPTWALPAIFNDDYSGLSYKDEENIRLFLSHNFNYLGVGHFDIPEDDAEHYISNYNQISGYLLDTCVTLTYYVHSPVINNN